MNLSAFGKNAFLYLLGNVCVRASGFVLIPLYTYSLSLADFGVLATLLVTIQMMTLLMGMGTDKGFLRFASEHQERGLLGGLLGTTLAINCAGALTVTALCLLLSPFFARILNTPDVTVCLLLACGVAFAQALFDRTVIYFRAKNQAAKFLMTTVPVLLLLIGANVFYLVIFHQGVKGALQALILAYGTVWIVVFLSLARKIRLSVSLDISKRLLHFSLPLVSAQAAGFAMDMFAVYFLGYFAGQEEVAIYSLGYKIAQVAVMVCILPFQLAYEPFVYANLGDSEVRSTVPRLLTYLLVAYAIVSSGLAYLTRPILAIAAPPEYYAAYQVVLFMLPASGFVGVYYVAESLLGIAHKTWLAGGIITFSTLVALSLYYSLIPAWGIYGAIIVFSLSRIIMAVVSMAAGIRAFPVRLEYTRLGAGGALFLFLLGLIYFLFRSPSYLYYTVVPAAALLAVILLYSSALIEDRERSRVRGLVHAIYPRLNGGRVIAD